MHAINMYNTVPGGTYHGKKHVIAVIRCSGRLGIDPIELVETGPAPRSCQTCDRSPRSEDSTRDEHIIHVHII